MEVLYTAEATAWGGREGRAASSDGHLDVQLRLPKELGGRCFHSALKRVAAAEGVDLSESAITARVGLGMGRNRLQTAGGIRWIDFENACTGPVEWDLAFQAAEAVRRCRGDLDLLALLRPLPGDASAR